MKIERYRGVYSLDVKRLALPFKVSMPCPKCGALCVRDLLRGATKMSYPELGEPENIFGYCSVCYHEWEMLVVLDVTLVPAEPEKEN